RQFDTAAARTFPDMSNQTDARSGRTAVASWLNMYYFDPGRPGRSREGRAPLLTPPRYCLIARAPSPSRLLLAELGQSKRLDPPIDAHAARSTSAIGY